MKKLFFFLLAWHLIVPSLGANLDERRGQLLSVINEELGEIVRLVKQTGGRNPNLLLRMAELQFEKARLLKEEENNRYLSLSPERRRKSNKANFYKKSKKYFQKAQKIAKFIVKKFRNFKGIGEVYYILAFNAKEFKQEKKARKYLKFALKKGVSSDIKFKAALALADLHYNKSQYTKAIPLYERALRAKKDKWWTKDAYNLAWCYVRTRRYGKAIDTMLKVHRLSKNSNYVNMTYSVERDLAYFYTVANRVPEAIKFYKRVGANIPAKFLVVAKYLDKQGKYSNASIILKNALQYNPNQKQELEIHIRLITLYEKFGRHKSHLRTTKKLTEFHKRGLLNPTNFDTLKYQVQKSSATLQKQVAGKRYEDHVKIRMSKATMAVSYFNILADLDPKKYHKWKFHAGETLFAVDKYTKALGYYDEALNKADAVKDKKISKLSLDGMLASLGKPSVSKATKQKYIIPVYKNYLKRNPRTKKSFKVYQRLFNLYYKKNDIPNSRQVLISFQKSFPKSLKKQEAMIAKIMDYHKNKKDKKAIQAWVRRINKGQFRVSRKYAKKVNLLLLSMKFENVEKANAKGDKKAALKGYYEIYKSPDSSKSAKKSAAYNISVLFHELGDTKRTFGWAKRSLKIMSKRDTLKFLDSFIVMAGEFFNKRKFNESATFYNQLLVKVCDTKSKRKNKIFKNAYIIYLVDNRLQNTKKLIRLGSKCGISKKIIDSARFELLVAYSKNSKWKSFKKYIGKLEIIKKYRPRLIEPLNRLRVAYLKAGRPGLAKNIKSKILKFYSQSRRLKIPLEALEIIASFKLKNLKNQVRKFNKIKLKYPENVFGKSIKRKLAQLDVVTSLALNILRIGAGNGIVGAYKELVGAYNNMVKEVESFVPPKKSKEYIVAFQKNMRSLTGPLRKKSRDFSREANNQINKNKILTKDNLAFLSKKKLPFSVEYYFPVGGIIMDRENEFKSAAF